MRKNLTTGILALLVTAGAVACSDDDPTEPGASTLTSDEATALAQALSEVGMAVFAGVQLEVATAIAPGGVHSIGDVFTPQSHGGKHTSFTATVDNVPCPIGGDVSAKVTLTSTEYPEEDRVVIEMEGTQTHDACRVMARQQEFKITGDPNLGWSMRLELVGEEAVGEQSFEYSGAFRWETPQGREGRCTVDFSLVVDVDAQNASLEGTFCGVNVEQTLNWTDA